MEEREQKADFITHLISGNKATYRGEYGEAIDEYQKALGFNPDFSLIHLKLGRAYHEINELEDAILCYKRALSLNPGHKETLYHLGKAYEDSGHPIKAAVAFDAMDENTKGDDTGERGATSGESGARRRRRSSSGKSLQTLKAGDVASSSVKIFTSRPSLMAPVFAASVVLIAADPILRFMLRLFRGEPGDVVPVLQWFFSSPSLNMASLIYYVAFAIIFTSICAPFYASVMITSRMVYREREINAREAVAACFGMLSPLAGILIIIIALCVCASAASVFLLKYLSLSIHEAVGVSIRLQAFGALAIPLVLSFFIYVIPSIVIDGREMESSISKGFRFCRAYFPLTFIILTATLAPYLPLSYALSSSGGAARAVAHVLMVPLVALALIALTTVFTLAQRIKKPTREGSAKEQSSVRNVHSDD